MVDCGVLGKGVHILWLWLMFVVLKWEEFVCFSMVVGDRTCLGTFSATGGHLWSWNRGTVGRLVALNGAVVTGSLSWRMVSQWFFCMLWWSSNRGRWCWFMKAGVVGVGFTVCQ